jgi:hypothetical protein
LDGIDGIGHHHLIGSIELVLNNLVLIGFDKLQIKNGMMCGFRIMSNNI